MSEQRVDLGVGLPAFGVVFCLGAALVALVACDERESSAAAASPLVGGIGAVYAGVAPAATHLRLPDRAWREAAEAALERPTPVELPHAEWGGFRGQEPDARGIAFSADAAQILEIKLARPQAEQAPQGAAAAIDVEVFLVDERGAEPRDVRLAQLPAGESSLRFRLPQRATYVVRLRPPPVTDATYYVQLELGAALPFPVRGYEVKSFFGAPRDHGKRHHEGIDIYAPRRTPVLAVADGQATYRENRLGGHTVWLATATGVSYYYAHLERVAVGSGQPVRTGDVLGYVGDSGNAAEVGPHLHFGIYRWGKGAVDPLPMLEAREFGAGGAGRSVADAPLEAGKLAAAGCSGRPATTLTPFKRCTAAELLKQRPYSVSDGTCPEIAPPCLRMADTVERAPVAAGGNLELELAGTRPYAVELAAAVLEVKSDLERRSSPDCNESVAGLPGLCATHAAPRLMVF